MTLTDEIRTSQAPGVLGELLRSREGGDLAWAFVKQNWETILARFSPANIPDILFGITALSTPELAADVEQFFATHKLEAGAKPLEQALERLRINVRFRQREAANVEAYFKQPANGPGRAPRAGGGGSPARAQERGGHPRAGPGWRHRQRLDYSVA